MPAKVRDQLQQFKPLRIGGGGFLTGHRQHTDGTLVCRTDTYGAYLWDATKQEWSQLVTENTMPKADIRPDKGQGVYDIAIAPSDSSILYMCYNSKIYRSNDKGGKWTRLALPIVTLEPNGSWRWCSGQLAVNPKDANHVLLGTPDQGLLQSRDGGKRWSLQKDIPVPLNVEGEQDPGVNGVLFDPTRDGVIWAACQGHGYFRSQDNGETWVQTKGPENAIVDAEFAIDGSLYAAEWPGKTVWKHDGSWKKLAASQATDQQCFGVACDAKDANRVILATAGGEIVQSRDAGDSFSKIAWKKKTRTATKIPWLGWTPEDYLSCGNMTFDSQKPNTLLFSQGIGFWSADIGNTEGDIAPNWMEMTAGIEQLVANQIMATPNGKVFAASWDRPIFRISNPDDYPAEHVAYGNNSIIHCSSMDWYAGDPDIVVNVNFQLGSGVSRDGGENFAPFGSAPFKDFSDGGGGGSIAIGGPDNFVWVGSNRQGAAYTKDGGETWKRVAIEAIDNDEDGLSGLNFAYYLKRFNVTADRVKDGTFYLWHSVHGIFVSRDGGDTWGIASPTPLEQSAFNAKLRSVPGHEGHLFATAGNDSYNKTAPFFRSRTGGKTWIEIDGVTEVQDFGIGAVPPESKYPAIWIVGYVNGEWGIYRSDDDCTSWLRVSNGYPTGSLDVIVAIEGDKQRHDRCYVGFNGSGYVYTPGGKKAADLTPDVPISLPSKTLPAYMLPAAVLYRFGKRWSDIKAAHNQMERELDRALTEAAKNPGWTKRIAALRDSWKKH
jgi:photosystem II stability/assembly factor-like uncharacterized protein